jgi:hypothetical protein
MVNKAVGVALLLAVWFAASIAAAQQAPPPPPGGRTPAAKVGAAMAILATFEDAGVLPSENSPDANRLIRAVIQFQAAFMTSDHAAVRQWLDRAFAAKFGEAAPAAIETFRAGGWSSRALEAVVDYAAAAPVWDDPGIRDGLRPFNVGRADFNLLARVFTDARAQFAAGRRSIHEAYDARRKEMPGAKNDERRRMNDERRMKKMYNPRVQRSAFRLHTSRRDTWRPKPTS